MKQVRDALMDRGIDVVVNCAAHTAVDKCEEDIDNVYGINAIGPKNVATVGEEISANLV